MADITTTTDQIKTIWSRHGISLLLVIVCCFGIYQQTLSFSFLTNWDDTFYVTQNISIQNFTINNLFTQFKTTYAGNYAPLQMISYMLDHAFWGLNPAGFHFTNMLFHGLNGLLCYLLVWQFSGNKPAALIAGILFVIHPVQVESVAWVSQRKTVLSTSFFLASLLCYHRFRTSERPDTSNYLTSILLFACALLSKSVAVVLPIVLLTYEYSFHKEKSRAHLKCTCKRVAPFLLLAALAATVTILTQSPDNDGGRAGYYGGSLAATLITMVPVMVSYIVMLFLPYNLNLLYFPSVKTGIDAEVVASATFLAIAGWLLFLLHRKRPALLFWFTLFAAGLLPVSQIIPLVTLINDRYLYLPMIGFAGAVGTVASHYWEKSTHRAATTILLTGSAIVLSVTAHGRTAVWHDSVTLWSDTARKIPNSKDIVSSLAESHFKAGDSESAISVYREAFALDGNFSEPKQEQTSLETYATILMERGEFKEAEKFLTRLTSGFPKNAEGFVSLGECLKVEGEYDRAKTAYLHALQLKPGQPRALLGLGNLELDRGNLRHADAIFADILSSGVDGPDLRVAMARLATREGELVRALDHLEQAIRRGLVNPSRLSLVPEFSSLTQLPRFNAIIGKSTR